MLGIGVLGALMLQVGQWRKNWLVDIATSREVRAPAPRIPPAPEYCFILWCVQELLASMVPAPVLGILSANWGVTVSTLLLVHALAIGTLAMAILENWTLSEGLYFSLVTVCGIGACFFGTGLCISHVLVPGVP